MRFALARSSRRHPAVLPAARCLPSGLLCFEGIAGSVVSPGAAFSP